MKHILESKEAKQFLAARGLKITKKSCHNAVTLKDTITGKTLTLWADSDHNVACGIPGIFIHKDPKYIHQ